MAAKEEGPRVADRPKQWFPDSQRSWLTRSGVELRGILVPITDMDHTWKHISLRIENHFGGLTKTFYSLSQIIMGKFFQKIVCPRVCEHYWLILPKKKSSRQITHVFTVMKSVKEDCMPALLHSLLVLQLLSPLRIPLPKWLTWPGYPDNRIWLLSFTLYPS